MSNIEVEEQATNSGGKLPLHFINSINKDTVFTIDVAQVYACCGSLHIGNCGSHEDLSNDDKDYIFKKLVEYANNRYHTRNIVYFDTPDGAINKVLGNKFSLVDSYRNPNSNNIVEIRSYTLSLEEYTSENLPFDYDDEDWEPQDY